MQIRHAKTSLLVACATVALSGCAGLVAPFIKNPYAGNYQGTFTNSNGESGTASVNLTNIGNINGSLDNKTLNKTGSIGGSVNTSGTYNGQITFPGVAQDNVTGSFVQGVGNSYEVQLNGSTYTYDLILTKQ